MAQIIGALRPDKATYGEKTVLKMLANHLPKEFSVYVECPLYGKRVSRYPDFIILTNYGVVVLEVKDWVTINKADKYGAEIRTRDNQLRKVPNPVEEARQFALLLAEELKCLPVDLPDTVQKNIPWGFATVLPNLPTSVITRLRLAWGEEFVLNKDDLQPDRITQRLKLTIPKEKIHPLSSRELGAIRAVINPTVLIEVPDRPAVILDEDQEKIVAEPAKTPVELPPPALRPEQLTLVAPEGAISQPAEKLPEPEKVIGHNLSIRLVRGVAGSGKSLVLIQRARYLAAQYPEWKIGVITFNRFLSQYIEAALKGIPQIKVMTFHSLCSSLFREAGLPWITPEHPIDWLQENCSAFPIISELTPSFLEEEITWIKESGIKNLAAYLDIERKGRGSQKRLGSEQRKQVYEVLLAYQRDLRNQNRLDWADIPYIVLNAINQGKIQSAVYDAMLIDEAQDFAPIWIKVVSRLLKKSGVLFLADDPTQSIYRFYSWREKGVEVVGRTRHLRIPYRNTFEIYRAAYQIIQDDEVLKQTLEKEGQAIPEIDDQRMRRGPRPLLQRCQSFGEEVTTIREQIQGLRQKKVDCQKIAVLHRHRAGVTELKKSLRGLGVAIDTFHAVKGLEFDYVFISQLHDTFNLTDENKDAISGERRLLFTAMTRARHQLNMYYQGSLPPQLKCLFEFVDAI